MARAGRLPSSSHALLFASLIHILVFFIASIPVNAYQELSDKWLKDIKHGGDDFDINEGALLAPLLITRVPGTEGQVKAQRHFVDFFTSQLPKWSVEWQNSTGKTPATGDKDVPFQNLIIRRSPPWTEHGQTNWFTLVAHYDSKITPDGFIGATDSAAPCAILMHVARSIDENLTKMYEQMTTQGETGGTVAADMGVQIILLDGEEAFVSWTDTDSLYGSRSLAAEWERTGGPAMTSYHNPLDQISVFVLLDLLGSAEPKVPSYFADTHWAYQRMAKVESRMRNLNLLEADPPKPFLPDAGMASKDIGQGFIGDDHEPFMHRGVPILHIIPSPFPAVWHTLKDDGDHLHMATVRDWSKIVTGFTMEWLDFMKLDGKSGKKTAGKKKQGR